MAWRTVSSSPICSANWAPRVEWVARNELICRGPATGKVASRRAWSSGVPAIPPEQQERDADPRGAHPVTRSRRAEGEVVAEPLGLLGGIGEAIAVHQKAEAKKRPRHSRLASTRSARRARSPSGMRCPSGAPSPRSAAYDSVADPVRPPERVTRPAKPWPTFKSDAVLPPTHSEPGDRLDAAGAALVDVDLAALRRLLALDPVANCTLIARFGRRPDHTCGASAVRCAARMTCPGPAWPRPASGRQRRLWSARPRRAGPGPRNWLPRSAARQRDRGPACAVAAVWPVLRPSWTAFEPGPAAAYIGSCARGAG